MQRMNFTLLEKLAVIRSLYEMILINQVIDEGELAYLDKVLAEIGFRREFLDEAKQLSYSDSIRILDRMNSSKKEGFMEMLHNMALADGYADELEINLILSLYDALGFNKEDGIQVTDSPNLNYLHFSSSKQFLFPSGFEGNREVIHHNSCLIVESEVGKDDLFNVSVTQESESQTLWDIEVVFPSWQMRISEHNDDYIKLTSADEDQSLKISYEGPDVKMIRLSSPIKGMFVEYY